jgi:hypothetical protein
METIYIIKNLPKQQQIEVLLTFLIEISQNWYNAKEMCKNYCTDQTCEAAENYRIDVERLKNRIIELTNE